MRKNMIKMFVSIISILIFLSINVIAATNNTETQVIIITHNLGLDPVNPGLGNLALINVTVNRIGNLTYIENYYSVDSNNEPKLYTSNRYSTTMNDYMVSFTLDRPHSKHGQLYSLIEAVILMDNVKVYSVWINATGKYRSFNGTMKWPNGNPLVIKNQTSLQYSSKNATERNLSSQDTLDTPIPTVTTVKKAPGIGAISIILIFILLFRKIKKD